MAEQDALDEDEIAADTADGIPPHWRMMRLGNLCKKTSLIDPTSEPDKDFLYVDVSSVSNETFAIDTPKQIVGKDAPSRARKCIHAGDVLFATVRPTLRRIAIVPLELDGQVCSTGYCVLRGKVGRLDPPFIYFYLLSDAVAMTVASLQDGATYPAINDADVMKLAIPLPPLAEQRAIARVLRAVQGAIQARRREIALERERKAALMQRLFTQGTRGEATKITEIGEMPASWEVARLGNVGNVAYGLTVNGARRISEERAPYLTVANVTRGALRLDDVKQIGMLAGDVERYRLRNGDVMLIEGNGNPNLLGSAALWQDELPFALHQNHLIRARPNQTVVLSKWLMNYLNSNDGRKQLLGKAKTSSGLHSINSGLVADLSIPLPSLVEQQVITGVIDADNTQIAALERETALLDELFRALLEELMSGRLSTLPLIGDEDEHEHDKKETVS